jgi:alpha 1,2-mannosyltransferase
MKLFGFDVERVVWGYMVEVACIDWEFVDWGKGNKSQSAMCERRNCFRDTFGVEYEGEK